VKKHFDIVKEIGKISTIPTLPIVLDRITKLLHNPQTSADEIGRAITTDQALASKVLKLVNSAFYGFPGSISTITHAVVILGFATIKNIVLTASIFDIFRKSESAKGGFNMEKFWLHSIACGSAAKSIAKFTGACDKEECFIAGLIHDIGKIILCQYLPKEFDEAVQLTTQKEQLFYESEMALFGASHQEVGGVLVENWNLPVGLQSAVKFHHVPSQAGEHFNMAAVVHTADIFVRALDLGNGGDNKIPSMSEAVWQQLNLQNLTLQPVLENIVDEFDKATIFMQI
jgi:HD-like signal output (HDOD) protein